MDYLQGLTPFEKGAKAAQADIDKALKAAEVSISTANKTIGHSPYLDGLVTNPTVLNRDSISTLEKNEGFRDKIYKDSEGYLTIGIGHKLTADEIKSGKWNVGISLEEARKLASSDLKRETSKLYTIAPELKDNPATPILEDMAFNMGGSYIKEWKNLRQQILDGNYSAAADNILSSKYATQVGDRAKRNAEYLRVL